MEINEKLTELRNIGYDYDFIEGYEDGFLSETDIDDLSNFLTDLRNNNYSYEYIKGYEEGYSFFESPR